MLKYYPNPDEVKAHRIGCNLAHVGTSKTAIIVEYDFDKDCIIFSPDYIIAQTFTYNGRVYSRRNIPLYSQVMDYIMFDCKGGQKVFELFK